MKTENAVYPISACVITASRELADDFAGGLGCAEVEVRQRLGDVIREDSQVYILDTKVDDVGIWPAPLLLDSSAREKSWLFLLSEPGDVWFLGEPPRACAFFERGAGAVSSVASYLEKRLDSEASRRIERVEYVEGARSFIVGLEDGKVYALGLDDAAGTDSTGVEGWRIGEGRRHFEVRQRSGNVVEVPWDAVLHHCEPGYEYYKGRGDGEDEGGRAGVIGGRIRGLRERRGFSVTRLAELSGMKRPNLSRLENGRHAPSLETLERVADALGATVGELAARRG